jgi:hypothetical protein
MLLRTVEAERFLSFRDRVRLQLDEGLTVVTGPNGAGKTNLGLCIDLVRTVIASASGVPDAGRLDRYQSAGHDGGGSFSVALDLELDQERERNRVRAFVCAAYACATRGEPDEPSAHEADAACRAGLVLTSLAPLCSGRLVARYEAALMRPWFAAWEFRNADSTWHVVLEGNGSGQLRRGSADPWAQQTSSGNFRDWLLASKPQDASSLDFRIALGKMNSGVSFSVQALTGGPGAIPVSLRELAPGLSAAEYGNRGFSFEYVLSSLLSRALVLTDNRRLPMRSRFTCTELRQPAELRDGADVAAVLHVLKNGEAEHRERFRQIQDRFKNLTGRDLEVRSRHAGEDGQEAGLIIEPVAIDGRGERPVEFSGAGVQEALLLSALLDDEPGKIVVLDEPAVNLEPTVQRRLLRRLRGPAQRLVITHHPDLVPVEDPADLNRVVRVVPSPAGSLVHRPELRTLTSKEARRWLRLVEPAHVRALLFAPAVILCEGATEVGALSRWWRHAGRVGLPDPEVANIPIIDVGGHAGYGAYVRYLDAFGIPWAIVADGPALRADGKMFKQLADRGHCPSPIPADRENFAAWRKAWEGAGVFTLAAEFGDDGNKGGEFEAFMQRVDADLLRTVQTEVGRDGKPIVGSWFAAEHPEPPSEVLELYIKIAGRLVL